MHHYYRIISVHPYLAKPLTNFICTTVYQCTIKFIWSWYKLGSAPYNFRISVYQFLTKHLTVFMCTTIYQTECTIKSVCWLYKLGIAAYDFRISVHPYLTKWLTIFMCTTISKYQCTIKFIWRLYTLRCTIIFKYLCACFDQTYDYLHVHHYLKLPVHH